MPGASLSLLVLFDVVALSGDSVWLFTAQRGVMCEAHQEALWDPFLSDSLAGLGRERPG